MPYFDTSQAWLHHSSLLLQAQPTSTRITTKYTLTPPSTSKTSTSKSRRTNPQPPSSSSDPSQQQQTPPTQNQQQSHQQSSQPSTTRGTLTLKTYSPVSGICLKYRTDKAAEVGRLISSLGRLSRCMSGLPVEKEDEIKEEGVEMGEGREKGTGTSTPVGGMVVKEGKEGKGDGPAREKGKAGVGAGAGAGKKKKGKK
ncbi:MAG: hypothetical protein M1830_008730 [Pleopsidium flavum]|nr:MAG: hypothetical protein M1830_008735 [Pleopsidium flavum]KAI9875224.1 MAG: hypothetical protein M1830_008730 [Pleopsidium flavum]